MKKFKIIEKTTPFKGHYRIDKYLLQHTKFDGSCSKILEREVFERGHSTAILPYDPKADSFVFIEQFRPGPMAAGFDPWMIEIPAGIVEKGEKPEDVALRETQEEIGSTVTKLIHIMDYFVSQGGSSEWTALFCGLVDTQKLGGIHGLSEEDEDILTHIVPKAEALSWLQSGKLNNAPILIALLWFMLNEEKIQRDFVLLI